MPLKNIKQTSHSEDHTGEKPYNCIFYEKTFSADGEKTLWKNSCRWKTTQMQLLPEQFIKIFSKLLYVRVHTGEKSLKRKFCDLHLTKWNLPVQQGSDTGEWHITNVMPLVKHAGQFPPNSPTKRYLSIMLKMSKHVLDWQILYFEYDMTPTICNPYLVG